MHINLAGPMPDTKEGFKYILGIANNFSSFVMAVTITGKTHEEVMAAFTDNWTSRLGAPECLVLDNELTSQIVRRVCQALNIKHLPTPAYNLRSNAQIERQFRTIKELLHAVTRWLD